MASTEAHEPESRVPFFIPILWLMGTVAATWSGWQDLVASEGGSRVDSCLVPGSELPIPLIWLPASLGPTLLLLVVLRNRSRLMGTGLVFGGAGVITGSLAFFSLLGFVRFPCHPTDLPISIVFIALSLYSIGLAIRGPKPAPPGLALLASIFLWITSATVVSEASRVGGFLLRPQALKEVAKKRPSDGRTFETPREVELVVGLRESDERILPPQRSRNAPIEVGDPQIGPPEALVTVVLIDDPTRPGAERWIDLMDELQEAYRHEVRFAYKPLVPGGVCSDDPELVGDCSWTRTLICLTEQGLAWDALDLRAESRAGVHGLNIEKLTTILGVSPEKLARCLSSTAPEVTIKRNYAAWKMARAESLPYLDVEGFGFGGDQPDRRAIVTMIEGLLQRRPPPDDGAIAAVDLSWQISGAPTMTTLPSLQVEEGRTLLVNADTARETCVSNGKGLCSAEHLREACRGRVGEAPARRSPFARFVVRPECSSGDDCQAWMAHFQLIEPKGEWVEDQRGETVLRQNQGGCADSLAPADAALLAPFRCCARPG